MEQNTQTNQNKKIPEEKSAQEQQLINMQIQQVSSHLAKISITIHADLVKNVYKQTVNLFTQKKLDGFNKNEVPTEYVQNHFKSEVLEQLKNYFFKHCVIHFLYEQVVKEKITLSNYPRLNNIDLNPNLEKLTFNFDASIANNIELKEWKNFLFKPPRRKKYKDLDKQVASFLEKDLTSPKNAKNLTIVEDGDWVLFSATLIDEATSEVIYPSFSSTFWVKIKDEEVIDKIKDTFIGQQCLKPFTIKSLENSNVGNEHENHQYHFNISIKNIVKNFPPTLECFKSTFKLKNKMEVHNKLMEIFSYRNDQSQRKAIIEELFHLLLTKHRFEIPKHLVIRRQEDILLSLMQQPDYQVYKAQKDFIEHVELLAEKQLKEEIIIDQIAHKEGIVTDQTDVEQYLYLYNNKKLREFIYFKPLIDRLDQINKVINAKSLTQTVMREKSLNYVIYTLTH